MEPKEQTYGSALNAMQRYCAKRETCIFDIKRKLGYYQLSEEKKIKIIDELLHEGFVDEERYAKIFVRDKFKLNKWGKIKIKYHLKAKMVSEKIITAAFHEINPSDYEQVLNEEISKKVKGKKSETDKARIVRSFQSRGFELDLILKAWDGIQDS